MSPKETTDSAGTVHGGVHGGVSNCPGLQKSDLLGVPGYPPGGVKGNGLAAKGLPDGVIKLWVIPVGH